jgi:hypothetical protein
VIEVLTDHAGIVKQVVPGMDALIAVDRGAGGSGALADLVDAHAVEPMLTEAGGCGFQNAIAAGHGT